MPFDKRSKRIVPTRQHFANNVRVTHLLISLTSNPFRLSIYMTIVTQKK
jgi:hypothetical protein